MRVPTPNENNMDNGWQCTRCQSQLSRNQNKTERDFRRFGMHSPPGMRWSGHSDNSFSYAIRWNRMIVLASKTQAAPRVTRIGIYGLGHGVWGAGRGHPPSARRWWWWCWTWWPAGRASPHPPPSHPSPLAAGAAPRPRSTRCSATACPALRHRQRDTEGPTTWYIHDKGSYSLMITLFWKIITLFLIKKK